MLLSGNRGRVSRRSCFGDRHPPSWRSLGRTGPGAEPLVSNLAMFYGYQKQQFSPGVLTSNAARADLGWRTLCLGAQKISQGLQWEEWRCMDRPWQLEEGVLEVPSSSFRVLELTSCWRTVGSAWAKESQEWQLEKTGQVTAICSSSDSGCPVTVRSIQRGLLFILH